MYLKHIIKYWLPLIVYLIIIFYISSLQNPGISFSEKTGVRLYNISNYIYHTIEFGLLSFLFWRALKNSSYEHPQTYTIILSTTYAISDELHQLFVPTRLFSLLDISFDIIGILSVQSIISIIYLYRIRNKRNNIFPNKKNYF